MDADLRAIDIDPGTKTTWDETLTLARLYRTALEHLGVRGYPKTTGKRGIQVWIPIERGVHVPDTSDWVEKLSRAVGATVPDLVSWEWAKAERGGKARLDYTQNASIKTLVAPYAVRPRPARPVSAPIRWDELDDPDLRADRWTIRDLLERVARGRRPVRRAQNDPQVLPAAVARHHGRAAQADAPLTPAPRPAHARLASRPLEASLLTFIAAAACWSSRSRPPGCSPRTSASR